jgi:hypothetical protein
MVFPPHQTDNLPQQIINMLIVCRSPGRRSSEAPATHPRSFPVGCNPGEALLNLWQASPEGVVGGRHMSQTFEIPATMTKKGLIDQHTKLPAALPLQRAGQHGHVLGHLPGDASYAAGRVERQTMLHME